MALAALFFACFLVVVCFAQWHGYQKRHDHLLPSQDSPEQDIADDSW